MHVSWTEARMVSRAAVSVLMAASLEVAGYSSRTPAAARQTSEPLLLDMKGDGYSLTFVDDGVTFDLNGAGQSQRVAWTAPGSDDAFLALDENHNGRIDDGHELVGGASGPPNGFAMLAALD